MLFRKTKQDNAGKTTSRGSEMLSVIAQDTHLLGTLLCDGSIDFDGTIDGNLRAHMLTVRKHGNVKGDITVDVLHVYGKIDGLVKAKHVHLYKDCHVEGIIMHETLVIEDGAFIDGKLKRTDRASNASAENFEDDSDVSIVSQIRLIG